MGFKSFEQEYEPKKQELIVLRHEGGGGLKYNDFWVGAAYFLAYVDVKTETLYKGDGRLVWPVTEEEQKVGGCFGRFRHETIYRVKARALLDRTVPPGRSAAFYNQFYVTEILEANAACPILEDLLAEYQKPIVLKDDLLGELVLNKRMSAFEGGIMWSEHMISIMLDVDQDNKGSWTRARKAMGNMLKEQEKWDKEMRGFAAEKLTSLANDWQDEDDETKPEITKQDFAKRIQLRELSMTAGGSFTAYYDDDDMFLGHSVTVYGTLKSGIKTAQMEG